MAQKFATNNNSNEKTKILFIINSKHGKKIGFTTGDLVSDSEEEILFPSGSAFDII
ncbi:MAG: hypothetical protein PHY93_13910 [Bacteriovorax sp.]|nr:hypothetical protein [Bacteriovorax sp.]